MTDVPQLSCQPQLNDAKTVDGAKLHFISADAVLAGPVAEVTVGGLKLGTEKPSLLVIQPFLGDATGKNASDVIATSVLEVARDKVKFRVRRLTDEDAALAKEQALRFDIFARE